MFFGKIEDTKFAFKILWPLDSSKYGLECITHKKNAQFSNLRWLQIFLLSYILNLKLFGSFTRNMKKKTIFFSKLCLRNIWMPPSHTACRHLFGWQICKNWEHNYTGILSSYQSYQSRFGNWGFCLITYQTHWCVFTRFCLAKRSLIRVWIPWTSKLQTMQKVTIKVEL